MDDTLALLLGRFCCFLRRDALAAGLGDKALRRLVQAGRLHRVRHGAYTLRAHWEGLSAVERHLLVARCALRTAGTEVALSHTSAAAAHGAPVWGLPLEDVHLVRLDRRTGRREAGVRQHRSQVGAREVVEVDGMRVTSPARTCLDITTICGVEVALGVVDHFLSSGKVTRRELLDRCAELRWSPGSLTTELTFRLADPGAESLGETRVRFRCYRGGLPRPVTQFEITEGARTLYRLDLAWPEHRVWIEFDGREKYLKFRRPGESVVDAVLREKRREEDIARRTGWRCLRVTWADLAQPERLVARIAAVLAGGPVHV